MYRVARFDSHDHVEGARASQAAVVACQRLDIRGTDDDAVAGTTRTADPWRNCRAYGSRAQSGQQTLHSDVCQSS
jgi:hypothetical protein